MGVIPLVALLAVAAAATPPPALREGLPTGAFVEHLACRTDPTQTYTLYLPSRYDTARRWPALLVFDPRGRSRLAAELFAPAAETYGWVVVSSNDTRSDGPMEPNLRAVNALWPEVHTAFAVDPARVYAAGFSGGALLAWQVQRATRALAGVIAASGRFDDAFFDQDHLAPNFATAGDTDFNYQGSREVDRWLAAHGARHRLEIFAGAHAWMPRELATAAVEWMELDAMRSGLRPRDPALAARLLAADLAAAAALEAGGRPLDAMRRYRAAAATFRGLEDVGGAEAKADALAASAAVRAALEEERHWDAFEAGAKQREARVLSEIVAFEEPMPPGRIVAELDLERLQALARGGGAGALAARRVLESLVTQTAFYRTRDFLAGGHYLRAAAVLEVATRIKPDNPTAWYNLACARSRSGRRAEALDALSRAVDAGFADAALAASDHDLDALRSDTRFPAILSRMRR